MKSKVLIIDDEPDILLTTKLILDEHFDVITSNSGEDALFTLQEKPIDLVVCDLRMPGLDGLAVLEKIKQNFSNTEVIIQTAVTDTQSAVKAIQLGAYNFLVKPVEPEQLLSTCQRALEKRELQNLNQALKAEINNKDKYAEIIGKSASMKKVFTTIEKIKDTILPVLITGETGTGKELVARALHNQSIRAKEPFIAINCGAIPTELLESELFGHEQGAFTSAESTKIGKFELANKGTIFLDEIGNMPLAMQAKILRVLQEKNFERVGSTGKPIESNARVIAATNDNLAEAVADKKFRLDLLHRLNVIPLRLPPLRERSEDIELLANFFFKKYKSSMPTTFQKISTTALTILKAYSWPGNIRELEHTIQRIMVLEEGLEILPRNLPLEILNSAAQSEVSGGSLRELLSNHEKRIIENHIISYDREINQIAEKLGITVKTLRAKLREHGLRIS